MECVAIYLAGNIKKDHENESQIFWSSKDQETIASVLSPIEVIFLNPAKRTDDLTDQKSVFGRDMTQVFIADAIFVDVRERRGLGVGAEMMWAKMNYIPVITLSPKNSHYRKDELMLLDRRVKDYTHPFVESLSDVIVETVEEGAKWLREWVTNSVAVKGPRFIFEAMEHYQKSQLANDKPMRDFVAGNKILQERMNIQDFREALVSAES